MKMLGRFVFLISCLSDALGFWGGLRPGSGVFAWGFCGVGGVLFVCGCIIWFCLIYEFLFKHLILLPRRAPPGCSYKLAAVGHL